MIEFSFIQWCLCPTKSFTAFMASWSASVWIRFQCTIGIDWVQEQFVPIHFLSKPSLLRIFWYNTHHPKSLDGWSIHKTNSKTSLSAISRSNRAKCAPLLKPTLKPSLLHIFWYNTHHPKSLLRSLGRYGKQRKGFRSHIKKSVYQASKTIFS